MKIKKTLAVILAVAMAITLMPTMAFANSTNTASSVGTFTTDSQIAKPAYVDLKVTDATGIPAGPNVANEFTLNLTNGEFMPTEMDGSTIALAPSTVGAPTSASGMTGFEAPGITYAAIVTAIPNGALSEDTIDNLNYGTLSATSASKTSLTIRLEAPTAVLPKDGFLRVYLNIKTGSDDGAVTVDVVNENGQAISSTSNLTVAQANSGTTTATVINSSDVKTYTRSDITGASIRVQEIVANSIEQDQRVTFTLPKGCTWNSTLADFSGSLITTGGISAIVSHDGRKLVVTLDVTGSTSDRDSFTFIPRFTIGKDTPMGDITLSISSKLESASSGNVIADESGLVIAKYGEETVSITSASEDDEIVAGYLQDKTDANFYVSVTLKENVQKSLQFGRYIDFDFNDEVQIVTTEDMKFSMGSNSSAKKPSNAKKVDSGIERETDTGKDCSEFTWHVGTALASSGGTWNTDKANEVTFFIPVTVEADYTGDIILNVKGSKAGIDEEDVVVGKAISPVSVETSITKVVNGAQAQPTADITIKENVIGYLNDDTDHDYLYVNFDSLGLIAGSFAFDDVKVEVTEGDLEIGKAQIKTVTTSSDAALKGAVFIPIKGESTKLSTIKLSGVTASLARTLPEGNYNILVTGTTLLRNEKYNDEDFKVATVTTPYVTITTAADNQQTSVNATFVIGSTSYTVNGTTETMDVAPYIDSNDRTMLPIRYVAYALGLTEDNITYAGSTATISGPNSVVTITTGNNTITTSKGTVTMDTVAVNSNDRIYVPVRFIANALGAEVSWDASTRTVTVYTASK